MKHLVPVEVNVLEGLVVIDGEHAEEALSRPHILVPHGTVLLLTCSVQDVQQTGLTVDHHLLSVRVLQHNIVMTLQATCLQEDCTISVPGLQRLKRCCVMQQQDRAERNVSYRTCTNLYVSLNIIYEHRPLTDLLLESFCTVIIEIYNCQILRNPVRDRGDHLAVKERHCKI